MSNFNKRLRSSAQKLAIDWCHHLGDIPINKISDKFELKHTGSVSRITTDEMYVSRIGKSEKHY